MVALFHFQVNNHLQDVALISNADLFVDFFFVLSGFVIFANYEERIIQGFSLSRYMLLRFGRLYPLHLATLMLFVSSEFLKLVAPTLLGSPDQDAFSKPGVTPDYILQNLFLVQSFGFGERLSFNWPSWSISAEFYTYFIFALGIMLFKKRALWLNIVLLLLSLYFLATVNNMSIDTTYEFGIIRCILGFAAGAICWKIWQYSHVLMANRFENRSHWHIFEFVTLCVIILFVFVAKHWSITLLAPFVFMTTIFIFSFERGFLSSLLNTKPLRMAGTLSYSIYMTHAFIVGTIFYGLSRAFERKTGIDMFVIIDGEEKLGVDMFYTDGLTVIYMITVIGVSYISFQLIEEPFRKLSRRLVLQTKKR